jgi:RNA ligase
MALCDGDEAFFYSDQVLTPKTRPGHFRIFNYRLASYTQWLHPGALECRGVMFLMDSEFKNPMSMMSWPFEKFFNLNENPMTMGLDMNDVRSIQAKMDGSLISTFYFDGHVRVKSKGSLHSDQAVAAQRLLESPKWDALYNALEQHVMFMDHTVIMEYTAPDNRIVVPTEEPTLTVLAVRDNRTGKYVGDLHGYMVEYMTDEIINDVGEDIPAFIEDIPKMTGIEGFVLTMASGQRVKIKTDWYAALHHLKDSINSQRRLFECAVNDATDDLKAQFWDDLQAVAMINHMEAKVASIYNHMVDQVERFYQRNKHMERKDFAIKGQAELDKLCFGLVMAKYSGKEVDYKATLIKHRKNFGIKDDPEMGAEQ